MSISKIKAFSLLFITLLLIIRCDDNITQPIENTSIKKYLDKMVTNDNNYSTFSYVNNKLTSLQIINNSVMTTSVLLHYDNKERPILEDYINQNKHILKKYFYNSSSKLDSMQFMNKDSSNNYQIWGTIKYFYNNIGLLTMKEQYNSKASLVFKYEYQYDNNNNPKEIKLFSSKELLETTTMLYDNNNNPWYNLKDWLNYDVALSKNNIISKIVVNNNSQERTETKYIYDYGKDDYPIKRRIETNDSIIETKYYYQ